MGRTTHSEKMAMAARAEVVTGVKPHKGRGEMKEPRQQPMPPPQECSITTNADLVETPCEDLW